MSASIIALTRNAVGNDALARHLATAGASLDKLGVLAADKKWGAVREVAGLTSSIDSLDMWLLPDALWHWLYKEAPSLAHYPLGDFTERAFKRTVLALLGDVARREAVTGNALLTRLGKALCAKGRVGLLGDFLGHFFFECSIARLRYERKNPAQNFAFWYHFDETGAMLPTKQVRVYRAKLQAQCSAFSGKLAPLISKALTCDKEDARTTAIDAAFAKVLRTALGKNALPAKKGRVRALGVCPPLALHAKSANVAFSYEPFEAFFGRPIHSLVKDLLDIGVLVYMADLYTPRQTHLGRNLVLQIPVRHPEVWERVRDEMTDAISFLGRDAVSLAFTRRKERMDKPKQFTIDDATRCACLLSGGLDSLAGAVSVLEQGLDPIFVSHYASTNLPKIQKGLVSGLSEHSGHPLKHICVYAARAKGKRNRNELPSALSSVMAQHLRSFLFLALASATALESGAGTVFVFENGPVAINPLFSEGRVNTRTSHPHFLGAFAKIIARVFGVALKIENPFLTSTKADVVKRLSAPRLTPLVAGSCSCWNWFKVPLMARQRLMPALTLNHDGECVACLIRRVAVQRAGLAEVDALYLNDIFVQLPESDPQTSVATADYLRFCREVADASDVELLWLAPEFSICQQSVEPKAVAAMFRRQAADVIACFKERASPDVRAAFAACLG